MDTKTAVIYSVGLRDVHLSEFWGGYTGAEKNLNRVIAALISEGANSETDRGSDFNQRILDLQAEYGNELAKHLRVTVHARVPYEHRERARIALVNRLRQEGNPMTNRGRGVGRQVDTAWDDLEIVEIDPFGA